MISCIHPRIYPIVFCFLFLFLNSDSLKSQSFSTAKLDSFLHTLQQHKKGMGSLVLSQNGNIIYQQTFGFRDRMKGKTLPIQAQTAFHIGSISKVFTAVMVYQLIDSGKLQLETPLDSFFPSIPNAHQIHISHLLHHSSGVYNFSNDLQYKDWRFKPQTHEQMLQHIASGTPDFLPGTSHRYSNSNYVILGYIVEKITGKTYAENLQEKIVKPLGLSHTFYGNKIQSANNEAYAWQLDTDWKRMPETDLSIPGGAGALSSTPTDLCLFMDALMHHQLISQAMLDTMRTQYDGFGKGLFEYPFENRKALGHTGGIDGFASMIAYFPQEDFMLTYCTNAQIMSMNDVLIGVLKIRYNRPFTIPDFKPYAHTQAELDQFAGMYSCRQIQLKLAIRRVGTHLEGQATNQKAFSLESTSRNAFEFQPAGIRMEFNPAQQSLMLFQHGQTFVFERENGK